MNEASNLNHFINSVNHMREMLQNNDIPIDDFLNYMIDYDQPAFIINPHIHRYVYGNVAMQYGDVSEDDDQESSENNTDTDTGLDSEGEINFMEMDIYIGTNRFIDILSESQLATVQTLSLQDTVLPKQDQEIDVVSTKFEVNKFGLSQCSICITDFFAGEEICELGCKHVFHSECIKQWGKYKPECALCRVEIPVIA